MTDRSTPNRESPPVEAQGPSSTGDVLRAYLDAASVSYMVYFVGAVTAFVAVALSLSDSEAGLHSSALAVGMVTAGLASARLDRVAGARMIHFAALTVLAVGGLTLVWAPALVLTLAASALVGLGFGLVLAHINQTVAAGGGSLARVRYARGTLVATLFPFSVPLVIAIGIALGIGWQFVIVPALLLVGMSLVATRGRTVTPVLAVAEGGRLPAAYWKAWFLLVLVIAVEFATLFWSSSIVESQTGVPLSEATLVITAFTAGMVVSRIGLSFRAASEWNPIWLLRGGAALALLGTLLPWASTSFELSMIGFFVAGLGLGVLFPVGAALAMATAPLQPQLASGRLVLASGLAVLLAPLVLGVIADAAGIRSAWLLVPAICVVALAAAVPVASSRTSHAVTS